MLLIRVLRWRKRMLEENRRARKTAKVPLMDMDIIKEGRIRQSLDIPLDDKPRVVKFHIPCHPPKATHQSALRVFKNKAGKTFVGKSSKGRQTESQLLLLLEPHRPKTPLRGALKMKVLWNFPFRKSEPKKNKALNLIPCHTRPDCDNLLKFLCDCMERLDFFETGDAQIYDIQFIKSWAKTHGITITIKEQ